MMNNFYRSVVSVCKSVVNPSTHFQMLQYVIIVLMWVAVATNPTTDQHEANRLTETTPTKENVAGIVSEHPSKRNKRQLMKYAPRWPLNTTINYRFADIIKPFAVEERRQITNSLKGIQMETCLRFSEANDSFTGLWFLRSSLPYCYASYAGILGLNHIFLLPGCDSHVKIQHEVMHTLGFVHEQQRNSANDSIIYNLSAVVAGQDFQFYQPGPTLLDNMDTPYDFGSIMHYGRYYHAVDNAVPTLASRDKLYMKTIGQRTKMSFLDTYRINNVYCNGTCAKSNVICQNGGYKNVKSCSTCKCPDGFGGKLCEIVAKSDIGCGGTFDATNSTKTIPLIDVKKFGKTKFRNCNWLFKSQTGYAIELNFVKTFKLPCYNNEPICERSYLEIKLKKDPRATGFRLCCDKSPNGKMKSEGQQVLLLFRIHGNGERLPKILVNYKQEPMNKKVLVGK